TAASTLAAATLLPLEPAAARVLGPLGGSKEQPPGWTPGAALLVRSEAFTAVRGFDEDFFLYFEEADFCYRVQRAGWQGVSHPAARVVHLQGSSSGSARFRRIHYQSLRLYLRKRLGRLRLALVQAVLLILLMLLAAGDLLAALARPRTASQRLA